MPDIHGEFIIVESSNGYNLGVKPVNAGATIKFENVGSMEPSFQSTSPIESQTEANGDLACELKNPCSPGAYPFDIASSSGPPTSYPYVINVVTDGEDEATYRYVGEKLRVVLKVEGDTSSAQNIKFTKEGFTDGVTIDVSHSGGSSSFSIPNGDTSYTWSVTPSTVPTKYTFTVGPIESAMLDTEVVGSDESDLDVMPPPEG